MATKKRRGGGLMATKKDEWDAIHYPELTDEENQEIRVARRAGFASMFPAFPSADAQSQNTLKAARKYMAGRMPPFTIG